MGKNNGPANSDQVRENLRRINERIATAATRVGRDPAEIRLLPVSKTFGEDSIRAAYDAGCRLLGENKPQEAERKRDAFREELPDLGWAVIGHLQSNKAKVVARVASEFHALDRLKVAEALQRRLDSEDRELDVFVQVNTSAEESKYGLPPSEAVSFIAELAPFDRLRPRGLMTLALFSTDMDLVRPCFVKLRELRDACLQVDPRISELSMGMSGDFEVAIEEGATTVRVGTAIFGHRPYDEKYYWPAG